MSVELVAVFNEQFFYGFDAPDYVRVFAIRTQHFQCHDCIGHGREDSADTAFAAHVITHP